MAAMHGVNSGIGRMAPTRGQRLRQAATRLAVVGGIALIGGAGIWYGWSWWTLGRFIESTDDAYVGGEVTTIASKIAGFVDTVAITDNQAVRAGDLLVKLDDRDYRAQLAHAEASVAAQEAALANLEANARLQQAMIAQASAEITATTAELDRAQHDVDRYRALAESRDASLQRFQQADADYKKAIAADRKAHAAREAAECQLEVIATQKQQARAALDEAVANRDLARLNLSYTEIRSPIDGVVGNRAVRVGAYATVGAQLLAVVPTRGLWIDANFKENQLAHLRARQPVTITADALPGVTFAGAVASLAPATGAQFSLIPPENATGNFTKIVQRVPVRIVLDDDAAALATLRPGLSVVVRVSQRPDATMATREARR
jgi:membrane fusion protein, multidrug efflux system